MRICIGDVVTLRSGGYPMTVGGLHDNLAEVFWFGSYPDDNAEVLASNLGDPVLYNRTVPLCILEKLTKAEVDLL